MATTFVDYTGDGNATKSFSFPSYKVEDIKVEVDNVIKTVTTHYNITSYTTTGGGNVVFTSGNIPASPAAIRIFRDTDVDSAKATYTAGSAVKADDLNNNMTQLLYAAQEEQNQTILTSHIKDAAVTTAKIKADNITSALIADDQINSEHYVDGSIDTAHIADAQITTGKLVDSSVTQDKLAQNAVSTVKIAGSAVTTVKIQDGAVTGAKIADNTITGGKISNGTITGDDLASGCISASKIVDANVTTAKILDSNVTTAKIADDAVTNAKIAANAIQYEQISANAVQTDSILNNAVTSTKIADSNVTTAKLANNAVTAAKIANNTITEGQLAANAVHTVRINDQAVTTAKIDDGAVTTVKLATNSVDSAKIQANAVTTDKIADAELSTLAGMQSGTASKLAGGTALTADIADLNQIDGMAKQTTITDDDTKFPTSGAVVDYVAAQLEPFGGFEAIATESAFPNTQPVSGVAISIADAGGMAVSNTGTASGATVGGTTVNISGIPTNFRGSNVNAGVRFIVVSTGSGQNYTYHKATLKEDDLVNLSGDINDFSERYRVGSSNPTTSLDNGDLFFNTGTGKMLVYNGTNTAWEEVQSVGNFFINTLSTFSGTGGNSATPNGTAYKFTLSNAGLNAEQHLVSVDGVIQKPNSGTSQPSEGFAIDGAAIIFGSAPVSGASIFVITIGSTVNIGTPSNNTVNSAILQNGSVTTAKIVDANVTTAKITDANVTTAKIADDAVTAAKLASSAVVTASIVDSQITTAKINNTAVTNAKLATGAVTTAKITDAQITTAKINDDAVTAAKLANTSVTAGSYGSATAIPAITVDAQGRITAASTNTVNTTTNLGINFFSDSATVTSSTGTNVSITEATASQAGLMSTTHHNKLDGIATGATNNGSGNLSSYAALSGATFTGHVDLQNTGQDDNYKSFYGSSNDASIYHSGSHFFLTNGTGSSYLDTSGNFYIRNSAGSSTYMYASGNEVALYHTGNKRLETTSGGVDIEGSSDGVVNINTTDARGSFIRFKYNGTTKAYVGCPEGFGAGTEEDIGLRSGRHIYFMSGGSTKWSINTNGTIYPASNNSYDIGDSSTRVRNIYTNDLHLSNEGSSNDIDGSWGNWTIQEGESDLFLKNNRSGKKYKFNLTEVS